MVASSSTSSPWPPVALPCGGEAATPAPAGTTAPPEHEPTADALVGGWLGWEAAQPAPPPADAAEMWLACVATALDLLRRQPQGFGAGDVVDVADQISRRRGRLPADATRAEHLQMVAAVLVEFALARQIARGAA